MRVDILKRRDEILDMIDKEYPLSWISDILQCKQSTLVSYLEKMGIEYHGNRGIGGRVQGKVYKDFQDYMENCRHKRSLDIKFFLIRDGLKENKCEICGLSDWQGKPISLELHHKDGNHYNDVFENFSLVCPNCHAMLHSSENSFAEYYNEYLKNQVLKQRFQAVKSLDNSKDRKSEGSRYDGILEEKKQKILNSGIDFSKFGWVTKLYESVPDLGIQRHRITTWMQKYMPEFLETCYVYKRDRPHIYDN